MATAPTPNATAPRVSRPGADYWCRRCHTAHTGPMPPPGWLRLQKRHHEPDRAWFTVALYCSVACVVADAETTR